MGESCKRKIKFQWNSIDKFKLKNELETQTSYLEIIAMNTQGKKIQLKELKEVVSEYKDLG